MEEYNSDLVLHVIQYLNVLDSGRFAACCKRYYYLVHQFRRLSGPELVTVASWDPSRNKERQLRDAEMKQKAITQMRKKPNLVLEFGTANFIDIPVWEGNTIGLRAISSDIQVNQESNVEHTSDLSSMFMNFPNAVIKPFLIEFDNRDESIESLRRSLESKAESDWKAMIVYARGNGGAAESFITTIQRSFPNIVIVGGICSWGLISPEDLGRFRIVPENSVFGVVLGGDAPIRSVVSRGVESVLPEGSTFVVENSVLSRPGDSSFMFRGRNLKPVHMIQRLRSIEDGMDCTKVSARSLMYEVANEADFIGIKRPSQDGFELHMLYPGWTDAFLVMTKSEEDEVSLEGAEIDFFSLNSKVLMEDVDLTMQKLKEQTQGEEILGGIMFSCAGRGPRPGRLIREAMGDAQRFANVFPDVPCLGFYAGGEIGPLALARNENVFQTGRVALQGFTVVFALFIVPVAEARPTYQLDDCQENVLNFVNSHLS